MVAPMAGVRVIEVASWLAAPAATALMADLGADVVKVEPPGGDPWQYFMAWGGQGYTHDFATNYVYQLDNRGKRSITIDLEQPDGAGLVARLATDADILVTNLIPSRRARYGVDFEQIRAANDRIVYASFTGYGDRGPDAERLGFDYAAYWARSGAMSLAGEPPSPPAFCRVGQGDHASALNLLAAVLAALRVRDATGEAQRVEVTLQGSGIWSLGSDMQMALVAREQPERYDRSTGWNPIRNSYKTRDGHWLLLGMTQGDRYWRQFTEMVDQPDWAEDPRYATLAARTEHTIELTKAIEAIFEQRDFAEWAPLLDAHGLMWASIAELPEVVDDPQLRAMGAFTTIEHPEHGPFETLSTPFTIEGADVAPRGPAPQSGAHTAEVLAELGLTDEEVAELAARRLFG